MKIIKNFILTFLVTFNLSLISNGANLEKPISLQVTNLTRWKNSREAQAIQRALSSRPKGDNKYASVFKKQFLVLEAEPNDFGGFFALVVFKNYPKVLQLWVYEIDKNIFEVREALPLRVTLNKIIMSELEDRRLAPFWLTAPSP